MLRIHKNRKRLFSWIKTTYRKKSLFLSKKEEFSSTKNNNTKTVSEEKTIEIKYKSEKTKTTCTYS